MRLITPADDELYGLASAAGKLQWAPKLLAWLEDERRADPTDSDAARRHALAQMAVLPSVGIDFAAHARVAAVIEAFGDVLSLDPGNWLARYGRARLRVMFPSSYATDPVQMPGEFAAARDDLDHLIALQARHAQQPYFASTHALAAVVDRVSDDLAPLGRPGLLDALADGPRVPVRLPALGAILCEPFITLYTRAADLERYVLGEVMSALYGDQPVVEAVLRRGWPGETLAEPARRPDPAHPSLTPMQSVRR